MMQKIQEVFKRHYINDGELYLAKNIVMMVVGDNVTCIGSNSTVNKLVVIRVGCDKVEMIISQVPFVREAKHGYPSG